MKKDSTQKRRDEFNDILNRWRDFYTDTERKLVYHLYSIGYSVEKVADIIGWSRQALHAKYPPRRNNE